MLVINKKSLLQKAVNMTLAFSLVLSSVSASVPIILSQTAFAASTLTTSVADLAATVASADNGDVIDITSSGTLSSKVVLTKELTLTSSNGSTINVASGINAIGIQANNVTIENLHFEGTWNFGDGDVTRALEVSTSTNTTIKNNTFKHLRQPAYINDNTTGTISNNYTDVTKGWVVISNSDLAFTGNTWGENVIDVAIIAGGSNNYNDARVVGISDMNSDAVVENQFGPTKRLSDSFVATVSNGHTGDDGAKWNPYVSNIQSGVDRVVTGGTVHVAAGTYASGANINKTVILKGAKSGATALGRTHGAASESLVVGTPTAYTPTFNVTAANVTIDGFDFGPATDGAAAGPVGVDLGSSAGASVKNSIFTHNQRGISLSGATNVSISDNLLNDNNSSSTGGNNASIWGDGVNGISIANNELDGASNTAINLAGSQNIVINANVFKNTGNTAVIWQDQHVTFSNNYARGFTGSAFFVTGSSDVTVKNNDITLGPGVNGISISSASGSASSDVTVTGNTLSGFNNAINIGAVAAVSGQVAVHNNKLAGNTSGVNAPSNASVLVDATNNWWGAFNGPADATGSDGSVLNTNTGAGAKANGAVKYTAWCITDVCAVYSDQTLAAPTNLTPANGTVTNDPAFVDTWSAVTGAAGYEYQTSNTSDGTTLGSIIYSDSTVSQPGRYNLAGSTVTRANGGTPEGNYYWQVRTVNAEGVAGPWSVISKVTVDTTAPTATINGVAPTALYGSTIDVHAIDTNYKQVDLYTSGSTTPFKTYTGEYFGLFWLSEGSYRMVVSDEAGNTTTYNFTIDKTAPTITVKVGYVGNLTSKIFSNVSFSLYDANKVDKYVLNGSTSDFTNNEYSDANFQNIVSRLVQGENTLTLYDVVGNTTTYVFTYDSVAPSVPVHETPANNAVINTNDFYFEWNDVAGAVKYEMQNSQSPAINSDGSFSNVQWTGDYQQIQPTESKARSVGANGTWYWQVRAIDAAGNKSAWTTPWGVTIDLEKPAAPVVSATGVADNETTNSSSVTINWTKPSTDTAKYDYRVWTNAAGSQYNSQATAYVDSNLTGNSRTGAFTEGQGSYFVQVRAIDGAGNVSDWSNTFTVIYDSVAPVLTLNDVETNTVTSRTFTGTTEPGASVEVTVHSTPQTKAATVDANGNWTVTFADLEVGPHTVVATSKDGAGNTITTSEKNFEVTTTPVVTPTSQSNSSTTQQTTNATNTPSNQGLIAFNNTTPATDDTQTTAPVTDTGEVLGAQDSKKNVAAAGTIQKSADGTFNLFGIAWYWLLVALAAIAAAWWLIAAYRRRQEQEA